MDVIEKELREENSLLKAKVAMLEALLEKALKDKEEALKLAAINT